MLETPGVSRDPRLPVPHPPPPLSSTLQSPDLLRVRSGRRPVKVADPPRGAGPRGRQEGRTVKPQARGLSCWLLERWAVSQKCSCPFPHLHGSHLAPQPFAPPHCTLS